MKKLFSALCIAALLAIGGCGSIEDGNVGVRTGFGGSVDKTPVMNFYTAFTSSVVKYTTKEASIDLKGLRPKAKDNLLLHDMEVQVFYSTAPAAIPGLTVKYVGQSACEGGLCWPAYNLVKSVAEGVIYDQVNLYNSLDVQNERDKIAFSTRKQVQDSLDNSDPGVFKITRVIIKSVATDPSIEDSIQKAVQNQKKLEATLVAVQVEKAQAQVVVARAEGLAKANQIINGSLTREYLQHEANMALQTLAEKGNAHTVLFPANIGTPAPLINIK